MSLTATGDKFILQNTTKKEPNISAVVASVASIAGMKRRLTVEIGNDRPYLHSHRRLHRRHVLRADRSGAYGRQDRKQRALQNVGSGR